MTDKDCRVCGEPMEWDDDEEVWRCHNDDCGIVTNRSLEPGELEELVDLEDDDRTENGGETVE